MPTPLEALLSAGGVGMVQEGNEPNIDRTLIDCTVMGEFPLFS